MKITRGLIGPVFSPGSDAADGEDDNSQLSFRAAQGRAEGQKCLWENLFQWLDRRAAKPSRSRRGFTLIELLLTIAVIAILASLLLPALTRAKASVRFIKCRSNLRQLALGVRLYLDDHQVYPAFGTYTSYVLWTGESCRWGQMDPIATDYARWPTCTENFREPTGRRDFTYSYWYNTLGSTPPNPLTHNEWGLGLAKNVTPSVLPFGLPIKESEVVAPADMVAFADEVTREDGKITWTGPPYSGLEYFFPHLDTVGASFCDGHVERITRQDFVKAQGATDDFWRRWNRDHEPHPEVWRLAQ